ncbi:hypothetical protein, partial [Streptomyces clavuligerus]|uniref:hypothetical protein n=1 Tax=Streptomyces clavuligerus TaxID=1901 RepID=UPI001E635F6A
MPGENAAGEEGFVVGVREHGMVAVMAKGVLSGERGGWPTGRHRSVGGVRVEEGGLEGLPGVEDTGDD